MTRSAAALAAFVVAVAAPRVASGEPTKDACVDAYRRNQPLRRDGRLLDATKDLVLCADEACPEIVRADCVTWLKETQALTPSIVVRGTAATRAGRVSIDGVEAAQDGRSIEVDPGEHVVVVERPGASRVERRILVIGGEKDRVIDLDPPPPVRSSPRVPAHVYALGAAGAASLGIGAVFGAIGLRLRGELADCKPDCPDGRIDDVSGSFVTADVAFAVGGVSLAAALLLYLARAR